MTREEVLNIIKPMMARRFELSSEDKKTIEELFPKVLGKEVRRCKCKDRHSDALIEMYNYLKNNEMKNKSKYTLKAGAVLTVFGDPRIYTNANLTDEVAKEFLKAHPEKLNLFARVPEEYYNERKNNKTSKEEVQ